LRQNSAATAPQPSSQQNDHVQRSTKLYRLLLSPMWRPSIVDDKFVGQMMYSVCSDGEDDDHDKNSDAAELK
jgi:hypothetical protein